MTTLAVLAAVLSGAAAALLPSPRPSSLPTPTATSHGSPPPLQVEAPEPASIPTTFRVGAAAGMASVVWLAAGGLVGLALAGIAAAAGWYVIGRMEPPAVRRRRERLVAGLPHVVDLLAAALQVGASPEGALDRVAHAVDRPMRDELTALVARLRLGVEPTRIWSELGGHPQLGPLGRTLARATDSGASVAEAMHGLADDLRRGHRASVEGRARSVAVKAAAPLGLCLLPAFVLVGVVPLVAGSLSLLLSR